MVSFRARATCRLFTLLVWWFISQSAFSQDPVGSELGRSIYETGSGREERAIHARLHGSITLSGAAIACINCHGKDGRGGGGGEAFIRAPDIRWFHLSKPFAARRSGTAKPAYDRTSFAQAIRLGISSSGRKLDPAMPRTDLADDEIDSLIGYLARIDEGSSSDLSSPVVLGLLPRPGLNSLADTLGEKLANCSPANPYLPIAVIDIVYFDTPEDALHQLKKRLEQTPDTLILAPFLIGWETRYVQAMQQERATTILPFSQIDPPDNSRWYFHFPGLKAQILALLRSAWQDGYTRLRIEHQPDNILSTTLYDFARKTAGQIGITITETDQSLAIARQKSARLWLKPVKKEKINWQYQQNELILAPGLFFTQQPVNTPRSQHKSPHWRLAYPYAPQQHDSAGWLTPAEVWATAACEFLARVGEGSIDLRNLTSYSLQSWPLTASSTLEQSAAQVYLYEPDIDSRH